MLTLGLLLLSLLSASIGQAPTLTGYPAFLDLSSNLRYQTQTGEAISGRYFGLYWGTNGTILRLGVVVVIGHTSGYFGFGLTDNPSGGMQPLVGANDAQVGYFTQGGVPNIVDMGLWRAATPSNALCTSTSSNAVCTDASRTGCTNNAVLVNASRVGNYTIMEWTRPIAQSDICDRPVNLNGNSTIIFSVGSFGQGQFPFNMVRHDARAIGPVSINFTINEVPQSSSSSASNSATQASTSDSSTSDSTASTSQSASNSDSTVSSGSSGSSGSSASTSQSASNTRSSSSQTSTTPASTSTSPSGSTGVNEAPTSRVTVFALVALLLCVILL